MLALQCKQNYKENNKYKPFRRPVIALNHYQQVMIRSPMRPDLQILFGRFKDQINISCIGSWHWKCGRIRINGPDSVPCKSMLFQISKVGKLHQEVKLRLP